MKNDRITKVIVGADRIAANGDTCNKIGTYGVAILAREHGIPFYVAAPLSTIDQKTPKGSEIPIEFRDTAEIEFFNNKRVVPEGAEIFNPAFDVTPAEYIAGIITERGVISPPFKENIEKAFGST
jgi:methylthioribose-1-phosphate isomerase